MKDLSKPDKRRKYHAAFRAEALRLAEQSRSTQAAARALNIDPKRIYQWQKAAQTPVVAALGAALDPNAAAELRQLRALARRQALELELDILKNHCPLLTDRDPMSRYRFIAAERYRYPVQRLCQVLDVPASG